MSAWDRYEARMGVHGITQREAALNREYHMLEERLSSSLSYKGDVLIDGEPQNVVIINSDNLNEKTILSMPRETFKCGSIVEWEDNRWIITETDADREIYTKGYLLQCNYLLKWIDEEENIIEQWCAVEDGTKLTHVRLRAWFGILETICKNYSSNCWNTLKTQYHNTMMRYAYM